MKFKLILSILFSSFFLVGQAQSELGTALRQSFSSYSSFEGNAKSKMTNNRTLVFTVATDAEHPEEHTRALVLTADKAIELEDYTSAHAEVFLSPDETIAIVLNNDNNTVTVLGLDNEDTEQVLRTLENNEVISHHLAGAHFLAYGISFMEGFWVQDKLEESPYKNPFNYLAYADALARYAPIDLAELNGGFISCELGECTSGGAGSSECSIQQDVPIKAGVKTTCSVKCNTGYYACCNTRNLRCYCCKIR